MAKLIEKAVKAPVGYFKGGGTNGAIVGGITGAAMLMGINPFLAYLLTGIISHAYIVKNAEDKRITAFESMREALINLCVAD